MCSTEEAPHPPVAGLIDYQCLKSDNDIHLLGVGFANHYKQTRLLKLPPQTLAAWGVRIPHFGLTHTFRQRRLHQPKAPTMLMRSTLSLSVIGLLIAGTPAHAQDEAPVEESKFRQSEGQELVEIIIRLPDGRIIKRKEPKIASKVDAELPGLNSSKAPVSKQGAIVRKSKGVSTTNRSVTGGSNASSVNTGGGSGGGGGGSSRSSGGGGGGGGSSGGGGGHSGGNDGNLGDDSPSWTVDNSLLLDQDRTVWIYAWQDTGGPFTNLTFNIVVNPRNKTPERLAQLVAEEATQRNMPRVVLRLKDEFIPADREPFDVSNPSQLLNNGGYRSGLVEYWNQFAIELRDRGVEPDFVIMDQEDGIDFIALDNQEQEHFFRAMIESPSILEPYAPRLMRNLTFEQFNSLQSAASRAARYEYHEYALKFRSRFLRDVIMEAFNSAYGHHIPISNYNESNPTFDVRRFTNFPIPNSTIADVSSPICYFHEVPTWGLFANTSKDVRWNMIINNLNICRSAAGNGPVVPWVAAPGYGIRGHNTWSRLTEIDQEMGLWEVQMQHMLAMGIDNIILWNPIPRYNPNAAVSDRLVDQWLGSNPSAPTQLMTDLAPIPLDADEIVTNGVVTTYDEFLAIMGMGSSDPQ